MLEPKDSSSARRDTQPDVVRGVVGKPLQIEPLGNDIAGADPSEPDAKMRLRPRGAPRRGPLDVDTDLDTGVVTVTGSAPGTYELTYGAQVGAGRRAPGGSASTSSRTRTPRRPAGGGARLGDPARPDARC